MTNKSDANNYYRYWVAGVCFTCIFLYLYKDVFSALIQSWINVPAHSHGFFVPLVSLYIVWEYRQRIALEKISPNLFFGASLLLFACLLFLFGKASMVNIVQQGSMLVMICALIILLLGVHFMKILWVPVGYLILMFPFLDGLIRQIQWPFQLLSANMAATILQMLGVPVLLTENYIKLPGITLEVARACSGIQYMVSIIAIVILLMVVFLKKTWARLVLFGVAVVVGITVNWLRIILVALWVYYGGKTVHGPGHVLQGLFISCFGFLTLFAVAFLLRKLSSSPDSGIEVAAASDTLARSAFDHKRVWKAWIIALSLLVGTTVYGYLFSIQPVPLQRELLKLSTSIAGWQSSEDDRQVKPHFNVRGADVVLNRIYRRSGGEKITLYIGYFESQRQGKEIIHSDLQSLYDDSVVLHIDLGLGDVLSVNKVQIEENGNRYMSLYWYNINGRYVGSNVQGKIYSAVDSLIFKKSNGAFIGVSIRMNDDASQQYIEDLQGFVRETFPTVKRFLADNVK